MGWSNISYTRLTEPVRTTLDPRKVQRSDDIYTYIHTPQLHQKEGYPYHPLSSFFFVFVLSHLIDMLLVRPAEFLQLVRDFFVKHK